MNTTHHDRRIDYYKAKAEKRIGLWFTIGLFSGFLLACAWFAPMAGAEAPTRHQTLGAELEEQMPSRAIIRAIIKIGQCEQPAPKGAGYFADIKWDAFPNGTWPGGLGIMRVHHLTHRPPGAPADPTKATPAEQIRTAWRAYKHYRNIYGVGGGATFWACSRIVGFGGVEYDGTVVWR